ncbi:MAG: hypothetical protein HY653_07360 [Acidobacteria bacterium]|nr:hypothetical protein [Acidobacteriota bacterium]
MPRLAHYFLPGVWRRKQQVLFLDGANCFSPLRVARFARERRIPPAEFYERIRVARAFTCFQLEELIVRLPRALRCFPAQVVMITGLPDLFYDEDVGAGEAALSYRKTLAALRSLLEQPLAVAVFSGGSPVVPESGRSRFFPHLVQQASELWRFVLNGEDVPELLCERARTRLRC